MNVEETDYYAEKVALLTCKERLIENSDVNSSV